MFKFFLKGMPLNGTDPLSASTHSIQNNGNLIGKNTQFRQLKQILGAIEKSLHKLQNEKNEITDLKENMAVWAMNP